MTQAVDTLAFLNEQTANAEHILPVEGPQYLYIQWQNGDPKLKRVGGVAYTGGLLFNAEQDEEFPLGKLAPDFTFPSGTTKAMFEIGAGQLVVIAQRKDWYIGEDRDRQWFTTYRKDADGSRSRFLVFLRGLEGWHVDHGPLMLTIYGVNGSRMKQVVQDFLRLKRKLENVLSRHRKQTVALADYTFWIPVAPDTHQPASKNYSSLITPPRLALPEGLNPHHPASFTPLYVGEAMLDLCAEWWDEAQAWAEENLENDITAHDNGGSLEDTARTLGGVPVDEYGVPLGPLPVEPPFDDEEDIPFPF